MALVPWLAAVRQTSAPAAAALSFLVGTAYASLTAPWIFAASRTLGASPVSAALGLFATAAWTQGLHFALIGLVANALRRRPVGESVFAVAALFFAVEWVQSRAALGLPLGLLGVSQGSVPGVAQLAVAGGVTLISALVAAANQALACALTASRGAATAYAWRWSGALIGAWLAMAFGGLPLARALREDGSIAHEELHLILVQPNIPRGHRWAPDLQLHHLERVAVSSEAALRDARSRGIEPDAVLWPENLVTRPLDAEVAARLRAAVASLGIPVITGLVRAPLGTEPNTARSSILWLDSDGAILAERDKVLAVPVLESSHRSAALSSLARLFGKAASDGIHIEEARESGPLRGEFSAAAVLCFEALFPALTASRRDEESRVIVNLADDGWVPGSAATRQLTAAVRFRAIEQRLPLVRVAHGGLSAAFDAYGQPILALPLHREAHAVVALPPSAPASFAEKTALVTLPLSGFAVVWCAAKPRRRRSPSQTSGVSS